MSEAKFKIGDKVRSRQGFWMGFSEIVAVYLADDGRFRYGISSSPYQVVPEDYIEIAPEPTATYLKPAQGVAWFQTLYDDGRKCRSKGIGPSATPTIEGAIHRAGWDHERVLGLHVARTDEIAELRARCKKLEVEPDDAAYKRDFFDKDLTEAVRQLRAERAAVAVLSEENFRLAKRVERLMEENLSLRQRLEEQDLTESVRRLTDLIEKAAAERLNAYRRSHA